LLVFKVFWIVLIALAVLTSGRAQAKEPLISPHTRLLVFSPHPDDESLGAAGLIQGVLKAGGQVKVVFMTNGDGFPAGVKKADHLSRPTAADYRRYGARRRLEAVKAMAIFGVKAREVIFLGFPDAGLACLQQKFLAGPPPYRSPFTLATHPLAGATIMPHTDFTGKDLIREIEQIIIDFRPNLVATTPPQDRHPDHSATYFFVNRALTEVRQEHPHLKPKVLAFLIHFGFGKWPVGQGNKAGSRLAPPKGFPDKGIHWVSLPLTPEEVAVKARAIRQYQTQMLVMGRFMLSFARSNELFIREN
jgi:LmbE family N-acetylglucosaminyl deacetylase